MRALVTGGAGFIGSHLVDLPVGEGDAGRATVTGALNVGTSRQTSVLELGLAVIHAPGRPGEAERSGLAASAAGEALGWTPQTTLAEGVRRTLEAFA
jgi:nucleoside-diphosphate-sugar epimerase